VREVFILLERCLGCHSCELACAVEHSRTKTLFTAIYETPLPRKRLYVEPREETELPLALPLTCRHCEDAPCIAACVPGAMYRTPEGTVTNVGGSQECIGCAWCNMVCPFGVIGLGQDVDGKVIAIKCDLCPDRDIPACVEACPTKALVYMEADEFAKQKLRPRAATAVSEALVKRGAIVANLTHKGGYESR